MTEIDDSMSITAQENERRQQPCLEHMLCSWATTLEHMAGGGQRSVLLLPDAEHLLAGTAEIC